MGKIRWMMHKNTPVKCEATIDGTKVFVRNTYTKDRALILSLEQVFETKEKALASKEGRLLWVVLGASYDCRAPIVKQMRVHYVDRHGKAYCTDLKDKTGESGAYLYNIFETRREALERAAQLVAKNAYKKFSRKKALQHAYKEYQRLLHDVDEQTSRWARLNKQFRDAGIEVPWGEDSSRKGLLPLRKKKQT